MLRLPDFDYLKPRSVKEAVSLLADLGTDAMAVAGGTDVYPKMKRGQFTPRYLVSLKKIPGLAGFRPRTKEGNVDRSRGDVDRSGSKRGGSKKTFQPFLTAADSVSTPPLRNVGTIGWQHLCGYPVQLLRSNFFLAPGRRFLYEKGWRHLSGGTQE